MNENEIRTLIKLVEQSQIESLEIRRWFRGTVRITKSRGSTNGHHPPESGAPVLTVPIPTPAPAPAPEPAVPAAAPAEPAKPSRLIEVKSPMVGTFYRAPAPGAPPFVEVGKVVKPGDVLCIIEAMKLMNDIDAEVSGKIVKVIVENGQPVEFGQPLFIIDPDVY
jgi:acetyl-CoA carboxylase biotin carboxyl carrier protein